MEQNTYEKTCNSDDFELTKDRMQFIAAYMGEFQEHAENIAEKYLKSLGHHRAYITTLDYTDFGGSITIRYEIMNRGYPEQESETMPIHYLWDDDWEKEIDQIIAKRKKAEQYKKKRDRKNAEVASRKRELQQLAALKAKYEKED